MDEQVSVLNPLAVPHLLQHTLRSLCLHENSNWVYAVFWRILPRNYPPPKWELGQGGAGAYHHHRSRSNRRNWILVWEDGFCNFSESASTELGECLKPQVFFKMSHEIYNYGEGLMGKVAADYSQQWVYKEPNEQDNKPLWQNAGTDSTIALIAVREGVLQLGSLHRVTEDQNYVVLLRKRFTYIESIPGVLFPHPTASSTSDTTPYYYYYASNNHLPDTWHFQAPSDALPPLYMEITPSMNSLEALLSKLPSVAPSTPTAADRHWVAQTMLQRGGWGEEKAAAEEGDQDHHLNQ